MVKCLMNFAHLFFLYSLSAPPNALISITICNLNGASKFDLCLTCTLCHQIHVFANLWLVPLITPLCGEAAWYVVFLHRGTVGRGDMKNPYELLNLRNLKISKFYKINIFQCMGKIFCVEFQRYLWNSTQNTLLPHWKIYISFSGEIISVLRFKSLEAFLKWTSN